MSSKNPRIRQISKAEINELPMRHYEGPIHLCKTAEEAEVATDKLLKETILGFDTETRPAFRRGEKLGKMHFWISTIFVNVLFFPMHFVGLAGMPRRIPDYSLQFADWNMIAFPL